MKIPTKIAFGAIFCLLIGSAVTAQAEEGGRFYVAGYLGFNLFEDSGFSLNGVRGDVELDDDISFGGALGFKLGSQVRVEAELNRTSTDLGSLRSNVGTLNVAGDLDVTTLMLNGYYDFGVDWPIQPFVSAGAGIGYFDGSARNAAVPFSTSGDDYGLVYQLGAGLRYRFNDTLALTGGYRYVGSSDVNIGNADIDYSAHELRMGLSYAFP